MFFTIHITPIYNPLQKDDALTKVHKTTRVVGHKFSVYGPSGEFDWIVYGERLSVETEPLVAETDLRGSCPYLYVRNKKV